MKRIAIQDALTLTGCLIFITGLVLFYGACAYICFKVFFAVLKWAAAL